MPALKSLVLEPFLENRECTHLGVTQMCRFLNNGVVVWASQVALVEKHSPASAGDLSNVGLIPGWGRCPWRRPWCPLQWAVLTVLSWGLKRAPLQTSWAGLLTTLSSLALCPSQTLNSERLPGSAQVHSPQRAACKLPASFPPPSGVTVLHCLPSRV